MTLNEAIYKKLGELGYMGTLNERMYKFFSEYVPAGTTDWDDITNKPAVIAAGADKEAARVAIDAGTSNLTLGTTSTTALAGNYIPPRPSTAEAQAGTSNTLYMTPLRTAEAVSTKLNATGGTTTGTSETFVNKGSVASGTVTLDFAEGAAQRVQATGNITLALSNIPTAGKLMELLVVCTDFGGKTITWPTVNWVMPDGSTTTTTSANGVTWQTTGTDFVLLLTFDGGTTLYGKVMR